MSYTMPMLLANVIYNVIACCQRGWAKNYMCNYVAVSITEYNPVLTFYVYMGFYNVMNNEVLTIYFWFKYDLG